MPAHSFPSDVICKRRPVGVAGLWFRGNLAFGWFTDLLDYPFSGLAFCSFSRLALGLDLHRSFAFCLCGSLYLRDPGSFSLCLRGRFALDLAGGFTLRLLCRLALRPLRGFAPGFLRGGTPCSLGCGFATRGLSPGLFSKRVELCGPVVCLLDRSRTVGGIELCLLCSGLELRHLLPCRICVRTTLHRSAF